MAPTALVLLPGLDGTGVLFRPLLDYLPNTIRPVVVAYPPDQIKDYEALLPIVLHSLPQDQPFVLLGESFSGPLAVMAAATCPKGLLGVILCASFVRNPLWLRPSWLRFAARPLAFRSFRFLSPMKTMLGGYSTPALRTLLAEALAPVRPDVLACRARAILEVDVRQQLRSCPVPFLYIQGQSDRVVPRQNLQDLLGILPQTRVATIDSPHLVLQTRPQAAAGAIVDFIGDLTVASSN
jgi:pimeloyl-[acyl-carrier protein] methyl ester esterase